MRKHAIKWLLCLCLLLAMMPAAMADDVKVVAECLGDEYHKANGTALDTLNFSDYATKAVELEDGKLYYLRDDLPISGSAKGTGAYIVVPENVTATICLNGKTLTSTYANTTGSHAQQLIQVNGTLNICDCSEEKTGAITHNSTNAYGAATIRIGKEVDEVLTSGILNLYSGNITGNKNVRYGAVYPWVGVFNMYGGKITDNATSKVHYGSAVGLTKDSEFHLYDGEISGNVNNATTYETEKEVGGAVFVAGGLVKMFDGKITGNIAKYNGAGVFLKHGEFQMSGGEISGNTATNCGGGIFNLATVKISGTAKIGTTETGGANSAKYGGGIDQANGTLTMTGGTISGNKGSDGAGGLYVRADTDSATLSNVTINGNTATNYGAGIHNNGGTLTLNDVTVRGNTAGSRGGGIYNVGTLTLNDVTIDANKVTTYKSGSYGGGQICNHTKGQVTLNSGTITNADEEGTAINANISGGCILNYMGSFIMNDGTITSAAGKTAAAVYTRNSSGTFVMYGGTIDATGATEDAVHAYNQGSFQMFGGRVIGVIDASDSSNKGTIRIFGGECDTIDTTTTDSDIMLFGGIFGEDYSNSAVTQSEHGEQFVALGDGRYELKIVQALWTNSNLELGKTLNMNVYFNKGAEYGYYTLDDSLQYTWKTATPAEVKFTYKDGTIETVKVTETDKGYMATATGIAAKEMADDFTIELYDDTGKLKQTKVESVCAYARRVLNKTDDESIAAHQLMVDMLAYGAAAQVYFDHNAENLATNVLTAEEMAKIKSAEEAITAAKEKAGPDADYAKSRAYHSANLTLENDVDFNLYFWIGQLADTNYTISLNDGAAEPGTFEQCLDATVEDGKPLLYKVKVDGLTYADLVDAKVTITFTQKDDHFTTTITDSVINYLVRNDGKAIRDGKEENTDNSALYGRVLAFANSCVEYNKATSAN